MKRLVLLLFFFPALASAAQYARPDGASAVVDQCSYSFSGTYVDIDEVIPSNADYVSCEGAMAGGFAAAMRQFTLSDVTDPVSSSGHILRWRCLQGGSNNYFAVALFQGISTELASVSGLACDGSTETYTLTAGQADAITDYSNLEISVDSICDELEGCGSSITAFTLYWAELEVPDASGGGSTRRAIVVQ